MKARVAMLLAALCMLAVVTQPSPGAAASQKWSRIGLSRDGHHWAAKMEMPLFARGVVLVPNSGRTARFYVRNQSGETARLKVLVRVHDRSGWLRNPHLRMRIRTADGHWIRITGRQAASQMTLRPGQGVPVRVVVRLTRRAGNRSMGRHLTFTVVVRLTQRTGQGTM